MSIRLLSAFLGFWEGFQESCADFVTAHTKDATTLLFSLKSFYFSFRSLFCGYWKKYIFLLSSSISVCNSCAEFVSEIFVQLIWFFAVQSFFLNCFSWRSFRQKTPTSKEGFRQTSWTWNVHVGFNCCYYIVYILHTVGAVQIWCCENSGDKKGIRCLCGGWIWPEAQCPSINA